MEKWTKSNIKSFLDLVHFLFGPFKYKTYEYETYELTLELHSTGHNSWDKILTIAQL